MFASRLNRLRLSAAMLSVGIFSLGFEVRMRETAYHLANRYARRTGLVLCAVDLDDDDIKAAIAAAVEEAVSGLKAKNQELQGKLKKAQKSTDIDPAEVEKLEAEVETLRTQLSDANKALKDTTKKAETAAAALAAEQGHTQKLLIENGLTAALTEAGVKDPALLKAAAAMIQLGHKPAVVIDGEARVAKVGDKALGEFVKEWAQGADGKSFVAAPSNGGGGATGGSGGAAKGWKELSMTEQGALYKENPAQAKALASQAGVTLA
jgi:hypothetical protein